MTTHKKDAPEAQQVDHTTPHSINEPPGSDISTPADKKAPTEKKHDDRHHEDDKLGEKHDDKHDDKHKGKR
jgi:hypothetical protein